MRTAVRREREEYRWTSLVRSAKRLRTVSPGTTLDMAADMIASMWSLRDAGEAALVRRRR